MKSLHLFSVAILLIACPHFLLAQDYGSALVKAGELNVIRGTQTLTFKKGSQTIPLRINDTLRTLRRSRIIVVNEKGNKMLMGSNAVMQLKPFTAGKSRGSIRALYGKFVGETANHLRNRKSKGQWNIRTTTATIGVKGSIASIQTSDVASSVANLAGSMGSKANGANGFANIREGKIGISISGQDRVKVIDNVNFEEQQSQLNQGAESEKEGSSEETGTSEGTESEDSATEETTSEETGTSEGTESEDSATGDVASEGTESEDSATGDVASEGTGASDGDVATGETGTDGGVETESTLDSFASSEDQGLLETDISEELVPQGVEADDLDLVDTVDVSEADVLAVATTSPSTTESSEDNEVETEPESSDENEAETETESSDENDTQTETETESSDENDTQTETDTSTTEDTDQNDVDFEDSEVEDFEEPEFEDFEEPELGDFEEPEVDISVPDIDDLVDIDAINEQQNKSVNISITVEK